MNNTQLIAFLRSALSEAVQYNGDDNIQPSMRYSLCGNTLAGQIRSLIVILESGQ